MPVVDVYGERKAQQVMRDTWGHLAPVSGREYRGWVLFAFGTFAGDYMVIDYSLEDLAGGPWFYEDIHEWIVHLDLPDSTVYRWTGTYASKRRQQFIGEIQPVPLTNPSSVS